ncbi:MAG: DNA polymerase III subunit beta [Nitrospirota bacterium]
MVATAAVEVNAKRIASLRKVADGMTKQIEEKLNSATSKQRPTRRRAKIADSLEQEGRTLQKVQHALNAIADGLESGTLPESLAKLSNRVQVDDLIRLSRPSDRLEALGIDFERAKADIMEIIKDAVPVVSLQEAKIRKMERDLIGTKIPGYFPTPREIVEEMLQSADIAPGMKVLEPSAGKGNIADVIRELYPEVELSVVERNWTLCEILKEKEHNLVGYDFLLHEGRYDRIIMNPPFENGQDMDHVRHAYSHLNPGGIVVSIVCEGAFCRTDKKACDFKDWMTEIGGTSFSLPSGSFSMGERSTGVNTRIVVLYKEESAAEEAATETEEDMVAFGEGSEQPAAEVVQTPDAEPELAICRTCKGRGEIENIKCADCKGTGWAVVEKVIHEDCNGHGCDACHDGWIARQVNAEPNGVLSPDQTQKDLNLKHPAGDRKRGTLTLIRNEFEECLKAALDIAERRNTMPILSHIHIKAEEGACRIEATDIENSWSKVIVANPVYGAVDMCVPLHLLAKEVSALHADIKTVELSFKGNTVKVNGRCDIFTLRGDEFPALKIIEGTEVAMKGLPAKIKRVLVAAGESDTRYVLNGVYIDLQKGRIVATDGHRLHIDDIEKSEMPSVILSRKTAGLIAKHGADTLVFGDGHVSCALAGGVLVSRLHEGTYPNYENVIPKELPIKATFSGAEMLKVLEGAVPIAASKSNAVKLSFNGQIDVHSTNPDIGQYHWYVPCEKTGDDISIAINAQYLIDSIRSYTTKENDTVIMEINEQLTPVLINSRAVVMPMRL